MKVGEMISKLITFNPDLEIICGLSENESITGKQNRPVPFDIINIESGPFRLLRDENGEAYMKFAKLSEPCKYVLIEISKDF